MSNTSTKAESIEVINDVLNAAGYPALSDSQIADWGIIGGYPVKQLREWANDYISEQHSIACEKPYPVN